MKLSRGKKIWLVVFAFIAVTCGWNCRMIIYGMQQGKGQLNIVLGAKPIEKVLQDPDFPDSLKSKLQLIQEIRQFAIDSLGINDSKNYTTVYDQKGKPVLWVVTACERYKLEAYEWKYPFLGKLAYMGFFKYERAQEKEAEMKAMGYDTDIGEVPAWSTLGWFKDPILSNMLNKNEGEIARLIIHELTHGTLYVKGNTDFSENLATFVGDQGAYYFLANKYGKDSPQYAEYANGIVDIQRFSQHMLDGANQLDSLYNGLAENMAEDSKSSAKQELIQHILTSADTLSLRNRQRFSRITNGEMKLNNTFFITYKMYREKQSELDEEFRTKFNSDFEEYLHHLKEKYG